MKYFECKKYTLPLVATLCIVALAYTPILKAANNGNGNGTGGIPAVLEKLDAIFEQVQDNATTIADLKARIEVLDANTIPCTLDRFLNDECGDYNLPFNLSVSLCAVLEGNAGAAADFQINNNNTIDLGIGWPNVAIANFNRTLEFPGIPGAGWAGLAVGTPVGFVYGSPIPNLQAGVSGSVGLGLDGCIDIPIPIRDVPRDEIIALMASWEAKGSALQQNIMYHASNLDLRPDQLNTALSAMEVVQSKTLTEQADIAINDPLQIFNRGSSLGTLMDVLPVGDRVKQIVDSPELLMEAVSRSLSMQNLTDVDGLCEMAGDSSAPELLKKPLSSACKPAKKAPDFDKLIALLERIDSLPTATRVKNLICNNVTLNVLFPDCK
jgi:hypothetical protein